MVLIRLTDSFFYDNLIKNIYKESLLTILEDSYSDKLSICKAVRGRQNPKMRGDVYGSGCKADEGTE